MVPTAQKVFGTTASAGKVCGRKRHLGVASAPAGGAGVGRLVLLDTSGQRTIMGIILTY